MSLPSITLTGTAVTGYAPHLLAAAELEQLPIEVKLGRIKPPDLEERLKRIPKFSSYFDAGQMAAPPPASVNRRDKAAASIARMYRNDVKGCCVIAGKGHFLGVLSANDPDSGGVVLATDAEIDAQYVGICGPGDRGCMITDVLDTMVRKGFQAGGKLYKLDGYCAVDNTNKLAVKTVQVLGGASTIGFDLPQAWTNSSVWDVTNSPIAGGHDVTPIDYDEKGVYVSSWGRIYLMTWAAFMSKRWISEFYFMLAPLWYGADKMSPAGVDDAALKADLALFRAGQIPPIDAPPTPTPPPAPSGVISPVRSAFGKLKPQISGTFLEHVQVTEAFIVAQLQNDGYK